MFHFARYPRLLAGSVSSFLGSVRGKRASRYSKTVGGAASNFGRYKRDGRVCIIGENGTQQHLIVSIPVQPDGRGAHGGVKKWVARLNSDEFGAKAKLKGPVTCLIKRSSE